jgi:hypothetical protein
MEEEEVIDGLLLHERETNQKLHKVFHKGGGRMEAKIQKLVA